MSRNPFRKLPHRPSDYGEAASPQRTDDGGRRTEDGRQTADDGGQPSAVSRPSSAVSGLPSAPATAGATALEQFRGLRTRKPIHPLEKALLALVAAHLVFLPWALGTMHPWSQTISLVLSVFSFLLALLPRTYLDPSNATEYQMRPYSRLLRFPIFWLGLALLTLIVVQALNPAWRWTTDGRSWWMAATAHIDWLPSGVRVPFSMWGPWRMLMIYGSAWLTVCAVWVGFTRRRTLQWLFVVLALNGVALSGFGLAERLTDATKIFWTVTSSNASFFASFIYKNHAGAYLFLALAVTCGLGAWYYVRGVRRFEKSNPSGVFVFLATCIAVSMLVSYARGATLVMIGYLSVVIVGFIIFQWRLPAAARRPLITFAMLLAFGLFLKTGFQALNSGLAWDRIEHALSGDDVSVEARAVADHASFDMLKANWEFGTGSGSFRFLFPVYQQHYPSIWIANGQRLYWEHAHNDILEIPIELGVPGVLLILAAFGYWAVALLRAYAWQNALSAAVILGCLFVVGMSWGDFMFQNPAILITWCALWPACTRWAQLEERADGR